MSVTMEQIYIFLEEVTTFITVTIKDLHLSVTQCKERDTLMEHTRSLQDMVNNGSLSGWSDPAWSGLEEIPGMEWLGPPYDNRRPSASSAEWNGGSNPQYDNNLRAYRKRPKNSPQYDNRRPSATPSASSVEWSGDELDNDSMGGDIGSVPALKLIPTHCGWLLKKRKPGGIKSNWGPQKRWCCLKQGIFYYYLNDLSEKQQGCFSLEGYNAEQMVVKKCNCWLRLSRSGYRTYEFQASDEADLHRWLAALAKEIAQPHTQGSSPTELANRTLPPLPGQMPSLPQIPPPQFLPPSQPPHQYHIEPEPDTYDDTDIMPTPTDEEDSDSYDDVDPGVGPPYVPPRPGPFSDLKGPPQLPPCSVRPGKEGRGNTSPAPHLPYQSNVNKGPPFPNRPRPGPNANRPPTPPRRPKRTEVVSDTYEPVTAPPESDTDSDADGYDDAISEIVPPARLNILRKRDNANDDSGFSSQTSSVHSAASGDGLSVPLTKKALPPKPANASGRPPLPIPQMPQVELQSQLKKRLESHNQAKPSQGKPKPSFYKKLYVVQFDYTSGRPDELDLRRGDLIKIIDKQFDKDRWWTGSKEGKTGLVPKTHLTEVYKP